MWIQKSIVLVLSFLMSGCAAKSVSSGPSSLYRRSLEETRAQAAIFPAESSDEKAAIGRFEKFLTNLSADGLRENFRKTYAETFYFNDTLKEFTRADDLERYFLETAASMESCEVKIIDILSKSGDYYFRWEMFIKFKKFRKGEVQSSIGISQVRFNSKGRVIFHQDYWDSGANLFEKVPVLGWMIRKIKSRL